MHATHARRYLRTLLALGLLAGPGSAHAADALDASAFNDPPLAARPRAYWDWINGAVTLDQLTRDLEEMKDKGMGGGQMWDSGAHRNPDGFVPPGPPFLGPESVAAMHHSLKEAKRLGLELGLLTSSGWNAGGAWVTPKDAGKNAYIAAIDVQGPAAIDQALPFPVVPELCPKGPDGMPLYWEEIAVLAVPQRDDHVIPSVGDVHNLTEHVSGGVLHWQAPAGRWTILRFICTNNGQRLIVSSPNSDGLLIDFLDPAATRMHFQYILDKLEITPENAAELGLAFLAVESMELEAGIQWTAAFANEFQTRMGYDIRPWLPALAGWTIESPETSQRFLYDYHKVVSDLLIFAHYTTGNEMLDAYGIDLSGEAGGPGPPIWNSCPVDAIKALGNLDIPQGEFWIRHRNMFLIKEIASASHVYGKGLVDAEGFTTWRRWKDGPSTLKFAVDRAFCEGLNRITYHGFAHTPDDAGLPGRVYHAGVDINPRVTWWPMARPFMDYMARCCYMLQQGTFVADACYYYGDQAPNFWPEFHDVPEKPLLDGLGKGYDYDVVNSDVILNRMAVKDGRIVLSDGVSYRVLILRDQAHMPLDVLRKIESLVNDGATIIGPKPTIVASLRDHEAQTHELRTVADALWGAVDGYTVTQNTHGAGRVVWGKNAREVLLADGVAPDFTYDPIYPDPGLDYIHRTVGDNEVYFVRNPTAKSVEALCAFRVADMTPSWWDPMTGSERPIHLYTAANGAVRVPIQLPPGGAGFVVFRPGIEEPYVAAIRRGTAVVAPEVTGIDSSHVALTVWENETYEIALPDETKLNVNVSNVPPATRVLGPWTIRFPEGWGAQGEAVFPELMSWTEHADEGIKYFSGIATYSNDFNIDADALRPGRRLYLDLGDVRDVATVRVNGHDLGIVWTAPFRVEVTSVVAAGENRVEIDVANMWINRLTGDQLLPPDQRFCRTNETQRSRDIGGDELWHLQPAGLLGPVRLMRAVEARAER